MEKYFGDLKFMIGLFFVILSVVLVTTGNTYKAVNGVDLNLNLYAGILMFCLGATMLALVWRDR